MDNEKVVCVWRAVVERLRPWTGWTDFDQLLWSQIASGTTLQHRTPELEEDTSLLQVAVYGIVSYMDAATKRTLVYRRGKAGSENRLHSKLSIGLGGHVNQDDVLLGKDSLLRSAMRRELQEELGLAAGWHADLNEIGILFDAKATGVEAVHIGQAFDVLVSKLHIDSAKIEEACDVVGWLTHDEIRARYFQHRDQFELWSQWAIAGHILADWLPQDAKETA